MLMGADGPFFLLRVSTGARSGDTRDCARPPDVCRAPLVPIRQAASLRLDSDRQRRIRGHAELA